MAGTLVTAGTALAVHDAGVFELDANAVSEATAGVDWDTIYAQAPNCTGALACSFKHEEANETIFTGGASKDDLDIPGWRWKNGSVPPKDDLADAFAARYLVPGYDPDGSGPLTASDIIYFGADRTNNSGDAFMGFWFFQANVTALTGGTFGPGVHVDGDILVITDFSGGGGNVDLAVYEWNGPGGAIAGVGAINGTLDVLQQFGAADCSNIGNNDPACARVNSVAITSPWPYLDKSGSQILIPTGEFLEGGVNLTALGLGDQCFSSFLAETRSSTSVNATLKDFIGGQFNPCRATLSTTPSAGAGGTVTPGTPVTDTATVVGSNPAQTPSGTVTFSLCGPTAVDSTAVCTSGGAAAGTGTLSGTGGTATATSSPAVNTATSPLLPGRYCFRADWPGDSNYVGALTHAGTLNSECFIVAKIPTSTTTSPSVTTISLAAIVGGTTVTDTAVVTGTAAGGDPTGVVNFSICAPAQLTPANTGVCSSGGTAVAPADVPLLPDSDATTFTSSATSGGVGSSVITAVGRYCFRAVYGGSTSYLGSDDSRANECFTVTDSSSGSTAQNWRPNDSATFASAGGTALAGTVTFSLYNSLVCTGTVLYSEARNIATENDGTGSASSRTVKTTNDGTAVGDYLASATGSFSWSAVFVSTNAVTGSTAPCESTGLTLDNDITAP